MKERKSVQECLSHATLCGWERIQRETCVECTPTIARFKTHTERRWDSAQQMNPKSAFEGLSQLGDGCISPLHLEEDPQRCSDSTSADEGHPLVSD